MMKKVYTCFCTDVIHEGHLNVLKEAAKYGQVYVGVLSDEAMVGFNRFPTISLADIQDGLYTNQICLSYKLFFYRAFDSFYDEC